MKEIFVLVLKHSEVRTLFIVLGRTTRKRFLVRTNAEVGLGFVWYHCCLNAGTPEISFQIRLLVVGDMGEGSRGLRGCWRRRNEDAGNWNLNLLRGL